MVRACSCCGGAALHTRGGFTAEDASPTRDLAEMDSATSDVSDRMQLIALDMLAASDRPAGALSLAAAFQSAGIDVTEATAGRYLRQLDQAGLTRSLSKRGRVLTTAGERRLQELRMRAKLAAQGARVAAAANTRDIDELIDLLHARRAIELEAARLAATRATEEELRNIAKAASTHVDCFERDDRVELSHNFHVLVAAASHNRMLAAMAAMFLDHENDLLAQLLDRISADAGAVLDMALDHKRLVAALRSRDAAEAEAIMREHIDKLISVAVNYRDAQATSESGAA